MKKKSETRMTASIQVKEQRGLPQKFAGCVCVIINKHSFEPFMCLELEKNLDVKVQLSFKQSTIYRWLMFISVVMIKTRYMCCSEMIYSTSFSSCCLKKEVF